MQKTHKCYIYTRVSTAIQVDGYSLEAQKDKLRKYAEYQDCLTVLDQDESPIGIWGQRHLRHIKAERKALYTELLTSGRLNTYLADINEQATEQMLLLTKQIAEREGITEQLKAQDQTLWVQRMNNIRDRAVEIVNNDLIYA